MTYEEYKAAIKELDGMVSEASKALQEFPRSEFGYVCYEVRSTDEYKKAKDNYLKLFAAQREFNSKVPNEYMRRASKERREGTY